MAELAAVVNAEREATRRAAEPEMVMVATNPRGGVRRAMRLRAQWQRRAQPGSVVSEGCQPTTPARRQPTTAWERADAMGPTGTDWNVRATSFGSAADEYARYRPAPPAEAAEWAVGISPGLVIDLAAGTGKLTRLVLPLVDRVVAIDIDHRMLAVLGNRLPAVSRVAARGEELPVASGAAGAIVISSAWHWLDSDRAWPEMARVLRPGGTLAVIRSGPDRRVPWVEDVLGRRGDRTPRGGADGSPNTRRGVELPSDAPFSQAQERTFAGQIPYEVADLPGLEASFSRVAILPAAARSAVKAQVAARTAARPELADDTMVNLPLRCRVWRATRS